MPRHKPFRLTEIGAFDARRGYTRCICPGVGVSFEDGTRARADFWRAKNGHVVARLVSSGYVFHCEAELAAGERIPDGQLLAFQGFMVEALKAWLRDGVDDTPEAFNA